jgi:hypothetical protein
MERKRKQRQEFKSKIGKNSRTSCFKQKTETQKKLNGLKILREIVKTNFEIK